MTVPLRHADVNPMRAANSLRLWYWLHRWSSLICTVFMLLLCLTGLPLIFADEIDQLLGSNVEPPAMQAAAGTADLDAVVADAQSRRPGHAVQFLVAEADTPALWFVRLGETVDAPTPSAFFIYDARSGSFIKDYPLKQGVMNVLLRLHVDLFAGMPGMLFLGAMGLLLLLLLSLVSGTVLYGYFMRKLAFGTVRRQRGKRLKWLDLHNLLGIVALVWLTGVLNTLAEPIFSRWQASELAGMLASDRGRPSVSGSVSASRALATARAAVPGGVLSFMAFPGNPFAGPRHFVAYMQGRTPLTSKLLLPFLIDARSGVMRKALSAPPVNTQLTMAFCGLLTRRIYGDHLEMASSY